MKTHTYKIDDTLDKRMQAKIKDLGYISQSHYIRQLIERDLITVDSNSRLELLINNRSNEIQASVDSIIKTILSVAGKAKASNKIEN